jgi:hypothetical protein
VITLLTAFNWKYHGVESHEGRGSDKGIIGKTAKGLNIANETVAANEIITVTITVMAGVDDVITITDEDGNTVTTITFASGESTGSTTIDIPAGGVFLIFTSSVLSDSIGELVMGDTTITFHITVTVTITSSVNDVVTITNAGGEVLATVDCPEV